MAISQEIFKVHVTEKCEMTATSLRDKWVKAIRKEIRLHAEAFLILWQTATRKRKWPIQVTEKHIPNHLLNMY